MIPKKSDIIYVCSLTFFSITAMKTRLLSIFIWGWLENKTWKYVDRRQRPETSKHQWKSKVFSKIYFFYQFLSTIIITLEIKTFGLGSTIGDVFSEICSDIVSCVTSGNGDCWDIGLNIFLTEVIRQIWLNKNLVFVSMNNFKGKSWD